MSGTYDPDRWGFWLTVALWALFVILTFCWLST